MSQITSRTYVSARSIPPAPGPESPRNLPDFRLWLRDRWKGEFASVEMQAELSGRKRGSLPDGFAQRLENAAYSARSTLLLLERATLWWVSADMVDLMLSAVSGVPDDVRLDELPLPADEGIVVFEKPWLGADANDPEKKIEVSALLWGKGKIPPLPGRGPDRVPTLAVASYAWCPDERVPVWAPYGWSDWPLDDRLGETPWEMEERRAESFLEDRRVVAALWTFLSQPGIATITRHPGERQARRRSQRAGLPDPEAAAVRIVRLRQPEGPESGRDGEGEGREYHVRWLVSGHWRHQPVGPGRAERRLTFVRPHVKGPPDAPFRTPRTVKAWVR